MLHVKEVCFAYDAHAPTLRYDLEVNRGEIAAILGPSGSGKSTLLDIIAGFLTPLSGDIVLDGQSLVPLPPQKRHIAVVFQSNNLFDHLSVAKNVALAKKDATQAEVSVMLQAVGLAGYETKLAASLSGGEAQRVALARALLQEASILLLDEPFSALDSDTKATIQTLVRTLTRQRGWHVVAVTHDAGDLDALQAQAYTMQEGVLRRGV